MATCFASRWDNLAKLVAAIIEGPEPRVLTPQHEQVQRIEHYCWGVVEPLKRIEQRLAIFVEGDIRRL